MTPSRMLNRLIRRITNQLINTGVDRVAGKDPATMTEAERAQAKQAKTMTKQARRSLRAARRGMRF